MHNNVSTTTMHEATPPEPAIPEVLENAQTFELPAFESLTPEQQQAIKDGPGWITNLAPMTEHENPYTNDFHGAATNFRSFFIEIHTFGQIKREIAQPYQRFAILYPDAVKYISENIKGVGHWGKLPAKDLELLFKAYQVMSKLTDITDTYVWYDGKFNPGALEG